MSKSKRITIHVNQKTFDKFQKLATNNNRSLSDFMGLLINKQYHKIKAISYPPNEQPTQISYNESQQLYHENKLLKSHSKAVLDNIKEINAKNKDTFIQSKLDEIMRLNNDFVKDFKQYSSRQGRG